MLDQGLYNFYLSTVLGVNHYITPKENFSESKKEILFQNKTIAVVDNEPNQEEKNLLTNIMKAIGQANFEIINKASFQFEQSEACSIILFCDSFKKKEPLFVVHQSGSSQYLYSVALKDMLPPTNPDILKINKQKLWVSLQKMFKR